MLYTIYRYYICEIFIVGVTNTASKRDIAISCNTSMYYMPITYIICTYYLFYVDTRHYTICRCYLLYVDTI